ncbi:MAG: hypothetical protein EON52_12940 [Actinomycetales bacterium]|nr:MAG: hypothetical protein EON52_12940 [Actinomycetales bacterium]
MILKPVLALLATALAVGVGVVAGTLPGHHPEVARVDYDDANLLAAAQQPLGDRVQAAVDGVQDTGFYVGPELRGELTPDEVAGIERIIAGAEVPLYVVWWNEARDAGYNTPYAALDQLRVGVGEDGYYAVVTEGYIPLLESVGYSTPYIDADGKGRPADALTRIATEMAELPPSVDSAPGPRSDYWGGTGGGIAAGLLFAGLARPMTPMTKSSPR